MLATLDGQSQMRIQNIKCFFTAGSNGWKTEILKTSDISNSK